MSSSVDDERERKLDRRRRHRSGLSAETYVAAILFACGHRILARRFKTPAGEIDLIVVRGKRLGFVEVKRRSGGSECEAAITPMMRQRVRRAADLWLARNPRYQKYDVGFDLVFVVPWRFPIIMHDGL